MTLLACRRQSTWRCLDVCRDFSFTPRNTDVHCPVLTSMSPSLHGKQHSGLCVHQHSLCIWNSSSNLSWSLRPRLHSVGTSIVSPNEMEQVKKEGRTVTCNPNQKLWLNADVRALLKARDAAFRESESSTLREVRKGKSHRPKFRVTSPPRTPGTCGRASSPPEIKIPGMHKGPLIT
ncbi:unnamed protein product [Menidia menidia]|uniref:(Atlantic silverside) hypothetical protein n=1 Tax=Menidia menidia TaxID=238744 RepID=A0A8S4A5Q2_9TELE|nr:unnamed protein product [Menidia menidia]